MPASPLLFPRENIMSTNRTRLIVKLSGNVTRAAVAACLLVLAGAGNAADAAKSVGIDENGMNKTAIPGDDFYGFTHGGWLSRTGIPADRGGSGAGAPLAGAAHLGTICPIQ